MMKNKTKKKKFVKYSRAYDNPLILYICFIIMGLVLALLCAVTWHEGRLIDRSEAIQASGTYDGYIAHTGRYGSVNEIEICFSDRDNLFMDSAYWNANVMYYLDNIEKGESFEMLLHPTSRYIWEIATTTEVLLPFEDASDGVLAENIGFSVILGGFCILSLIMGVVGLALWLRQHRLLKEENKMRNRK